MSSIPDRPTHHKAPPVRGEFETELRHRCRQCRSKLAVPVENQHQAFCTKGCHGSFYLRRCLICELPLKKKTVRREVCSRRDCQNAFRGNRDRFRYKLGLGTFIVTNGSESPIQSGIKIAHAADRPWRQIAGPELSANAFHCAMVGADEAVEAACRINSRHWREAGAGTLIGRTDPPVNLLGGYRFPNAPDVELTSPAERARPDVSDSSGVDPSIPDDLSVPDFLKVAS